MLIASEVSSIVEHVDDILRKDFNKQLFNPKEPDQIRLLKLRVWSERYCVSVRYILSKLVPYFERLANKHSNRFGTSKGLGTTIAVLTGPAAEAFIKDVISKDYSDGENVIAWKEERRLEALALVEKDEAEDIAIKQPKGILHYVLIKDYVAAYEKRISRIKNNEEKITKKIAKQPWRGNPFR